MKVYQSDLAKDSVLADIECGTAVALGQFDSMHKGHIQIIKNVVERAKTEGLKSIVFMFSNDPTEIICQKEVKAVNTLEKRFEILEDLGVDIAYVKKFDEEFMHLSPDEFIDGYLVKMFNARYVAAGYNYRFGKDGAGDVNKLAKECEARKIVVCAADEVRENGETVSTTVIRKKIESGDVSGAAQLMGRYYSVSGVVENGNGIGGRKLGVPTANIALPESCLIPKFGVYISTAKVDGAEYAAITNVGARPTVFEDKMCIETHIDGDFPALYGKEIEVSFCRFIREIIKFDSLEELKTRLEKDKDISREYFEKHK